nr:M20 family metallopeptidase [Flocculibacter collagenilyticus]
MKKPALLLGLFSAISAASVSINTAYANEAHAVPVKSLVKQVESKVIEWRRDIHQHPELSNREFRTAKKVAEHLTQLGLEVETEIAHTGVVGLLKGKHPGPTVLLRADMDALPVTEQTDVPFKSTKTTTYRGVESGVMHACGHDTHVAMLMGAASVLADLKDQLAGNVVFVFQPAEEGAPVGEEGGAELMLKEGLLKKYPADVAFGLHITSMLPTGIIGYRSGPLMASADRFEINVKGVQSHGSRPWSGVDPIVVASQIVTASQTIISRQINITKEPAVLSFGKIAGGVRSNIIPDNVELVGTIRNFDMDNRQQIFKRLKHTAEHIAKASGATAQVDIFENYPVTINNPALTAQMLPSLKRVAGNDNVKEIPKITGAEDFSFIANTIPGLYFFLGATPHNQDLTTVPSNHSPFFYVDESALKVGTASYIQLTLDYLSSAK